jgi:hypothetical protein
MNLRTTGRGRPNAGTNDRNDYTLEQLADAAACLMHVIEVVDSGHKKAMDKLCK